uniref:Protein tyrosine phosphatase non-receptor type 20 n=1 Tax=Astyanax mexicanus TaxID=7994 RepID=A0A3B1IZ76_ASTMX
NQTLHILEASKEYDLENKKKNRYKNIVPCDRHYEVVLGKDGGYINANFIKMLVKDESFHYIACQGPLPTTLGDFWQMVWEQKSNVICQRYWPDASHTAEMVGERLQITLVKDQHLENFTNEIQRVTHLNYTGWPDHGTPTQPEQLLTFISYMRHIHQSGPIITHCSAGIGRSGTLICIDVVLGLNQQRLARHHFQLVGGRIMGTFNSALEYFCFFFFHNTPAKKIGLFFTSRTSGSNPPLLKASRFNSCLLHSCENISLQPTVL